LLYRISPVDAFSNLEPLVLRGTIDLLNFADGIDGLASHRQHSGQIAEFLTALQFPTPKTFHVKPSISFTPRADLDKSFRRTFNSEKSRFTSRDFGVAAASRFHVEQANWRAALEFPQNLNPPLSFHVKPLAYALRLC